MLIARTIGCSNKNVFLVLKALRDQRIYANYLKNFKVIEGDNIIVEIDESKIGKNKYNRGKPVKGFWCLGMVERSVTKKIMLIMKKKKQNNTFAFAM